MLCTWLCVCCVCVSSCTYASQVCTTHHSEKAGKCTAVVPTVQAMEFRISPWSTVGNVCFDIRSVRTTVRASYNKKHVCEHTTHISRNTSNELQHRDPSHRLTMVRHSHHPCHVHKYNLENLVLYTHPFYHSRSRSSVKGSFSLTSISENTKKKDTTAKTYNTTQSVAESSELLLSSQA